MQRNFSDEIVFRTSRSGGKGGQNVNKVETAVEGLWSAASSVVLAPAEKATIAQKLSNKINAEGQLAVRSQVHRSQLANKNEVIKKMHRMVQQALQTQRPRIATRPSKSGVEKRLGKKKLTSNLKLNRTKTKWNNTE